MIYAVDIKDPQGTHIPWLSKVKALAEPRTFSFRRGLNVLWGRNGSGKSTIIHLLARYFHCAQGGQPTITERSCSEFLERWRREEDAWPAIERALAVTHDGQPVRFLDPGHAVGLDHGHFDWDFASMGVHNTLFRGSTGETTMMRTAEVMDAIAGEEPPKLARRHQPWGKAAEVIERCLAASPGVEQGPLTILMDEPERSLDLPAQVLFWRFVRAFSDRCQFIVASHSFYALAIPEAHYIELTPGYLNVSNHCLGLLAAWDQEAPKAEGYIEKAKKMRAAMAEIDKRAGGKPRRP